jgi:hypothetical protein
MKLFTKTLAAVGLMAVMVSAQSMQETVSKLGAAAGKAYVAPIVSGFGTNMNAAWFHKAPKATKFGLNVEAGAVFMGTMLSGGDKTFAASGAFRLDSATARKVANDVDTTGTFGQGQKLRDSVAAALRRTDINVTFTGPTIIGSEDKAMTYTVDADPFTVGTAGGDTTINLPATVNTVMNGTDTLKAGILDGLAALPLMAPQLTIGTIYGTNVTLRWLPEIETNEDIGKIKFFGFGIQHNPAVWGFLPPIPVDVSLAYFTQSLKIGTLFEARSQAFGINASKQFGFRFLNVTPYGGLQYETSSFDFSYDYDVDGEAVPVKFSVDGENKYRATAGLSVRLLAININGDYNFGKYNSFSAGVMVGL